MSRVMSRSLHASDRINIPGSDNVKCFFSSDQALATREQRNLRKT